MEILKNIEAAAQNTAAIAKVKAEIVVTDSLIEMEVKTLAEAKKLELAFKRSFSEVEIFDLSEIEMDGFIVNIRY